MTPPLASLRAVCMQYGEVCALDHVTLEIPSGKLVGVIGPDGVGKSTLLGLLAGARRLQQGEVRVFGGSMASAGHRQQVCHRIAYMPQGLGRNLYPTLSVQENLEFFGTLFGHSLAERRHRIQYLTAVTGLGPFLGRPAAKLSGGMKQKLGLCCALIHDPQLLILDEPTTGVDPLARRQFWRLLDTMRQQNPALTVLVATAYMQEAQAFDYLVVMDAGRVLTTGTPQQILQQTNTGTLEAAFVASLPAGRRGPAKALVIPPLEEDDSRAMAIEANGLTCRFGDFTAVDHVSFQIRQGEIFGFLGSNGCGKSTTMKMLTGLLPPTEGQARLFGQAVESGSLAVKQRVGYMSQSFSLYSELTVQQNLVLHARLFNVPQHDIAPRVHELLGRFGLGDVRDTLPPALPLGMRQRLSLAVAVVHRPELLILDEPTSGVDPLARDMFWQLLVDLARGDGVTIFLSTHFMNEGERCDRISLMHAGRVLVSDSPAALVKASGAASLEDAFIAHLEQAAGESDAGNATRQAQAAEHMASAEGGNDAAERPAPEGGQGGGFSLARALGVAQAEWLQLRRDPLRRLMALLGTVVLMFVMGYGINMDVEDLSFAVLDHDQTQWSHRYTLDVAGSRYFVERAPLRDDADMDARMRSGELSLAIEIPPGFGRDVSRGRPVEVAAWIDGANPQRAETVRGYLQGMHQHWLQHELARRVPEAFAAGPAASLETRFRYNPDVRSLPAMVPAVIPLLLLMIPAMLAALSVVREKELGSITNLYVTPVSRAEFLLGKQLPYVAMGMLNFFLMVLLAVTVFGVPLTGSFAALSVAALAFVMFSTGFGLFASSFTRSQIAAIFLTMLGTLLPAIQFAGLLNPVSGLEGVGAFIGRIYPATYFLTISRGAFSKALGFDELAADFMPLLLSVPVILLAAVLLLRKQER